MSGYLTKWRDRNQNDNNGGDFSSSLLSPFFKTRYHQVLISSTMKTKIQPIFTFTLLVSILAVFGCRAAILQILGPENLQPLPEFSQKPREDSKNPASSTLSVSVHNETLLSFAALEIGEEDVRREINDLLEGNYPHSRSISSYRRGDHGKRVRKERVPAQLSNPRYAGFWPEFRKNLRNWARNKRYQPEIMRELVSLVKNPIDRHSVLPQGNSRYTSCAVVGNSGILLNKNYGSLIDSHEVVIRLNNARIHGFSKNVGSKTSISFINSNILHLCSRRNGCFCHPYDDNVPIVMYVCQAVHFMDYTMCNASHKAPLIITDVRFDMLCSRIVKYYSLRLFMEGTGRSLDEWNKAHEGSMFHYSSGMQAIMLAVGMCDRVSIFGFGKSEESKHHYHTNQKAELHLHHYEAEYAFYKDLIERPNTIPFLKDSGHEIPPITVYH